MGGEDWSGDWLSPMGIDLQINGGLGITFSDLTDKDFDQMNGGTILLQNDTDGKGDYIKSWKHPTLSKPTKSELDSV